MARRAASVATDDDPARPRSPLVRRRGMAGTARLIVRAMRPRQWTKNAVVFAPLVFGSKLFDFGDVAAVLVAAILFCLTSGSVYLLNDLIDAEADRAHPLKRHRPIASGQLSLESARFALAGSVVLAVALSLLLDPRLTVVLASYGLIMSAYSLVLKHLVIIDVFVIAAGFVLRALAGSVVIDVPVSPWLYVCTVLLSLFLGFAKRRHELVLLHIEAVNHRRNLDSYSARLLDELIAVVAAATIMAYSLYTFSAANLPDNHAMMLTIPFVLYGIFRYLYLVHREEGGGAPEQLMLEDAPLFVTILLWAVTAVLILYLF